MPPIEGNFYIFTCINCYYNTTVVCIKRGENVDKKIKNNVVNIIKLCDLPIGHKATVVQLYSTGAVRRRLLDLGLVENTVVESVRKSPLGDPIAYNIRGALIALRSEEASNIMVKQL